MPLGFGYLVTLYLAQRDYDAAFQGVPSWLAWAIGVLLPAALLAAVVVDLRERKKTQRMLDAMKEGA